MARGPPPPMPPGQFAPPRPGGGPPQPFPVPPQFGQQLVGPPPPGQMVRGPPAPPGRGFPPRLRLVLGCLLHLAAAFRCSDLLAQACLLHRTHKTSNSSSGNELEMFKLLCS
nr:formin-like protein 16 isoform X2 [Arachis hypogaea]